jgi:large subunit ribosomal protein L6
MSTAPKSFKETNAIVEKRTIEIPKGIEVTLLGHNHIKVKGPKGTLERKFERLTTRINIDKENKKIEVFDYFVKRKSKAMVGTLTAHIVNMMRGVQTPFVYKLKIIYSHFPISVKIVGKEFEYSGMYGQKGKKKVPILGEGTKANITGDTIVVEGIDLEKVSQTAARLEQSTRLRGKYAKDVRIFQDGIYVFESNRKAEAH